jgi:hypothetical protein
VCNLANKCVEGNIALLAGSARRAVVVVEPASLLLLGVASVHNMKFIEFQQQHLA